MKKYIFFILSIFFLCSGGVLADDNVYEYDLDYQGYSTDFNDNINNGKAGNGLTIKQIYDKIINFMDTKNVYYIIQMNTNSSVTPIYVHYLLNS